jgi:hypothetical protein
MRLQTIRSSQKSDDLIGNRTRNLMAYSVVPQPTTLPRASKVTGQKLFSQMEILSLRINAKTSF